VSAEPLALPAQYREPLVAMLLDLLSPEIDRLVEERLKARQAASEAAAADPWMDSTGAARYACLTPEALRARARRGTIPAHRDGKRYLFHRDELDESIRRSSPVAATVRKSSSRWPRAVGAAGAVAPRRKP
jgi:excisionase family DNA binding protein